MITKLKPSDISQDFKKWASNKLANDKDYIEHRAKFGHEPLKSIAKLILIVGKDGVNL
jgi:hypothetical protein